MQHHVGALREATSVFHRSEKEAVCFGLKDLLGEVDWLNITHRPAERTSQTTGPAPTSITAGERWR